MIVKNSAKRVVIVPLDPTATRVQRLLPGWSPIADADWVEAKKHAFDLIERGELSELGLITEPGANGKKSVERSKTLQDLSPSEAEKFLKEVYDIQALEAWLNGAPGVTGESRDSVRVSIKNQIDFMKDRSPMNAEKDED